MRTQEELNEALKWTSRYGKTEIVKALLKAGAKMPQ